jgi:hypothetical protein
VPGVASCRSFSAGCGGSVVLTRGNPGVITAPWQEVPDGSSGRGRAPALEVPGREARHVKVKIVLVAARFAASELELVLDLVALDGLIADPATSAGSWTRPYSLGGSAGKLPRSNRRERELLHAVRVVRSSILRSAVVSLIARSQTTLQVWRREKTSSAPSRIAVERRATDPCVRTTCPRAPRPPSDRPARTRRDPPDGCLSAEARGRRPRAARARRAPAARILLDARPLSRA